MLALGEQSDATPTGRWEYIESWLRHHPRVEPIVIRAERGTETVGLAVLAARRQHGLVHVRAAGDPSEPFAPLSQDSGATSQLAAGVVQTLAEIARPWSLRLGTLATDGPWAGLLSTSLTHSEDRPAESAPRLAVDAFRPLNSVLTGNARAATSKARNRAHARGHSLVFAWLETPEATRSVLDEVIAVRARRNTQLNRGAADRREQAAFRDVVLAHASAGRAGVLTLRLDGVLAAYAICLLSADVAWVYSNSVDPAALVFSAGALTNAELIRRLHARPDIAWIDWGSGIQRYKLSGPVSVVESTVIRAWSSARLRQAALFRDRVARG